MRAPAPEAPPIFASAQCFVKALSEDIYRYCGTASDVSLRNWTSSCFTSEQRQKGA